MVLDDIDKKYLKSRGLSSFKFINDDDKDEELDDIDKKYLESRGLSSFNFKNEQINYSSTSNISSTSSTDSSSSGLVKKSSLWDDGYQFGDILGTVGATVGDVATNVVQGVMNLGEGIGDTLKYGAADIAELTGNKDTAEKWRSEAQYNAVGGLFDTVNDKLDIDKNSVLGETSDSIAQGLGYVAGMTAVSMLSGGAATALGASTAGATTAATVGSSIATFTSSYGNGVTEALNDGATIDEARIYGAISGAAEAGSELMFGGLGKASGAIGLTKGVGDLDSQLATSLTKNIKNKIVKNLVQYGVKATGEGLEEVVSGFVSALGKKATYQKDKDLGQIFKDEKLAEQFWMGVATSAIAQGADLVKSNVKGTDYITGRTDNEQKVYDNEVQSRTQQAVEKATIEKAYDDAIKTRQNMGQEITDEVRAEVRQKVESEYQRGNIRDEKLTAKQRSQIEDKVESELNNGEISMDSIRNTLGENQDISKDTLLQRSAYEDSQRHVSYQVTETDNEKINKLQQSAADAGLNNNIKTRKKIEAVSKLIEGTDRQYIFATPEQLKDMGYNQNANGVTNRKTGEIMLNANSNNGLMFVVGHEASHLFDSKIKNEETGKMEYSQEYKDYQDTIFQLAKDRGIYQSKMDEVINAYEEYNLKEDELKEELTANLTGELLFTDDNFVEDLTKNKTRFQKIYDYIKKLVVRLKGTEYEKQLQQVKDKFDTMYKTLSKETTNSIESERNIRYNTSEKEDTKNGEVETTTSNRTDEEASGSRGFKRNIENIGDTREVYENGNLATGTQESNIIEENKRYGEDNQGRKLAEGIQEYNQESKARDSEGRLINFYHSTETDFNVYDKKKSGKNYGGWLEYGDGFYFSPSKDLAKEWAGQAGISKPTIKEEYLNAKNPFYVYGTNKNNVETMNEMADYIEQDYKERTGYTVEVSEYKRENGGRMISLMKDGLSYSNQEVQQILKKFGYDSIDALEESNGKLKGQYVVFDENQIKNTDNENPTSSPDIRYSLNSEGELIDNKTGKKEELLVQPVDTDLVTNDDATLMAIHNLTEDKMKGILELGGFPVPSIAVTNPNIIDHSKFGDISVIFDKSTIDPANKENEVYDRDVWSPTFPDVEYEIDENEIEDASENLGIEDWRLQDYAESAKNPTNLVEQLSKRKEVIDKFIDDNNIKYDTKYKEAELSKWYNKQDSIKNFIKENNITLEGLQNDTELREKYFNALRQEFNMDSDEVEAINQQIEIIEHFLDVNTARLQGLSNDFNMINSGKTQTVDTYETEKEKRKVAEENGIKDYIKNEIALIYGDKGIYNGKEYITASGKRRSFWQLHDEYNLENVVEQLTKGETKGTQHWMAGYGQIQAQMAKKFNSIQDIKSSQSQLTSLDENNEVLEDARKRVEEDIDTIVANNDTDIGTVSELFADFAKGDLTVQNFKDLTSKWYQTTKNVSNDQINRIIEDLNNLKNLPTDYFEAKPQRAVGLDEVQAIVIPSNADQAFKDQLQSAGMNIVEYDPNVEGDRADKINQMQQYKFSLARNKITGDDIAIKDLLVQPLENTQENQYNTIESEVGNNGKSREEGSILEGNGETRLDEVQGESTTTNGGIKELYNKYKSDKQQARNEIKTYLDDKIQNSLPVSKTKKEKFITRVINNNVTAEDVTNWIRENNTITTKTVDEYTQSARKTISSATFYLSENLETELKNIYEKLPRNLKFSRTDGVPLDTFYKEVANDFTGLFDAETNINELDQAVDLIEFMRNNQAVTTDTQEVLSEDEITDLTNTITGYKDMYNQTIELLDQQYKTDKAEIQANEGINGFEKAGKINQLIKEKSSKISELQEKLNGNITDEQRRIINKQIKLTENDYNNQIQAVYDMKQTTEEKLNEKKPKLTRKEVREQLLAKMGITIDDISVGKDISSINYQITDPVRVNEKVFGREIGKKINDATINQTKKNSAEKIRWQNKEREEIKDLGIKARSKESAAVQKYGEKQYVDDNGNVHAYGDAELAKEFKNVETQNKIKHAAEVLRQKYDTYIDQMNNVLTSLGYDAIPKRENYMRHFQELSDMFSQSGVPFNLNDMQAEDLPTDINGLSEFNKPGRAWFANGMHRTGVKTSEDAITGIDGYLESAGNILFHTEDIQNYRALSTMTRDNYGQTHGLDNAANMSETEIQQRIQDIQDNKLSKYVAWLDEQANSLAGKKGAIDRGTERVIGRRAYTFLNTVKKQVGSNMTGFNVRSSLTNLISSTLAASKTNKVAFVQGTISTIQNMIHNDGFIEKSNFLTNRFGSDSLSQKTWQKISNAGQIFMTATDYFTSNQIVRSKYYEGLQNGLSEQEAIDYADDFASRVMGDRSQGSTAEIFNSKTLGLFTQFQLEVNNQWQFMIHDTKMDYQQNSSENSGLKAGATALWQMGQLAAYSYFFNELFEKVTGSRAAFDPVDIIKKLFGLGDDDDEDKTWDERLADAGSELVDNLPFASIFTGGRIPISEAFTGASTFVKKVTGQTDDYGNEITWEDVGSDFADSLPYWFMPTGYSQLKKTTGGLGMYSEENQVAGSYTDSGNLRFTVDEDVGSKVQAALFGKYANPYAQDYINSGYKSISSNNIDELVALGMNSTEYRNYKTALSEAGSTQDSNGYSQYTDSDGNIYWYDKTNDTMYDSNYRKTILTTDDLTKTSKKEEQLNYINSLDVSNAQKNIMANSINSGKKTIDMADYSNYGSYEEYTYSRDNPEKYSVITQITDYDDFNEYKDAIQKIKETYSTENGYDSDTRKAMIREYINGLDISSSAQKLMLEKMAGGYSIKNYKKIIQSYLDSQDLTNSEKYTIWEELFN